MATRAKKKVYEEVTLESAQEASATYAITSNKLQKIEAQMNEEINRIKSKYQDKITDLNDQLADPMEMLQAYAEEQYETWGKRKSMELLHCTIGFRTGTPKVTKGKGWTWEAITDVAKKLFPDLVRTKAELDKDMIIAMRDEDGFLQIKNECHLDVVQDETFFVVPKVEELVPQ